MADFNLHRWFKNQYLQENDDPKVGDELEAGLGGTGVAEGQGDLYSALSAAVPENTSYKDFAKAVAKMLIEDYGSHNFAPFMEILHAELGMNESLNEEEDDVTLGKEFTKKFGFKAFAHIPGKLEIMHKDDIDKGTFEEMINWVESKGYTVDRNQSDYIFDWDDDRYWYPRIMYK